MPHDIVTDTFMFCRSVGSLCYVATLVTAGQQASLVPGSGSPPGRHSGEGGCSAYREAQSSSFFSGLRSTMAWSSSGVYPRSDWRSQTKRYTYRLPAVL